MSVMVWCERCFDAPALRMSGHNGHAKMCLECALRLHRTHEEPAKGNGAYHGIFELPDGNSIRVLVTETKGNGDASLAEYPCHIYALGNNRTERRHIPEY